MYRVAMKRGSTAYFCVRGRGVLCAAGVRRVLGIPKNTQRIWAVFTKCPGPDKYTLKVTRTQKWWGPYDEVRVLELRSTLTPEAEAYIKRAVKKGYKYVHIEYEV